MAPLSVTTRVTALGKAAHAGNNHKDGANAIWALCRLIARLGPDVRVTAIGGGTSRNTVPDRAEARIETADLEALRSLAAANDIPGTTLIVDPP